MFAVAPYFAATTLAAAPAAAPAAPGAPKKPPPPLWASFVCGGAAACWAEVCTLPLDTCKVRLQIQGARPPGTAPKYSGMFNVFSTVIKEEGPQALWKGYDRSTPLDSPNTCP